MRHVDGHDFAGGLPPADQYFGTLVESEIVELATDTNAAGAEEIADEVAFEGLPGNRGQNRRCV